MKEDMINVTTTISVALRERLELCAGRAGLSLSAYLASMIEYDQATTVQPASTDIRKVRSQHGSLGVTIPPAVAEHLGVSAGAHLAFTPVHQAVIIRRI